MGMLQQGTSIQSDISADNIITERTRTQILCKDTKSDTQTGTESENSDISVQSDTLNLSPIPSLMCHLN